MPIRRRPNCPFADDHPDDHEDDDLDDDEDSSDLAYLLLPGIIKYCSVCKAPYYPDEIPDCESE